MAEPAEDVSYQRSMIFPKGTKIVGHIVKVTASGKGRSGSAIFVQFDKIVMKDGQEVILNAGIQALAVASPATEGSKTSADAHTVAEDNSGESNDTASGNETVVATNFQTPEAVNMPPGPLTASVPPGLSASTDLAQKKS